MMGGGAGANANLPSNLLGAGQMNPNALQGGFGGLAGNLQNNSQLEALLRGFNLPPNINLNNAMQGLGKLGGGMGNLPK